MRRFPKWRTSREQLADVSLLHAMIPLVLPHRIPYRLKPRPAYLVKKSSMLTPKEANKRHLYGKPFSFKNRNNDLNALLNMLS